MSARGRRRPRPARLVAVVFVTAYEEYAVRAFDIGACDYLLKPVSRTRLSTALDRALSRSGDRPGEPGNGDSIPLEAAGRTRWVAPAQVRWVEAVGDYVRLHLTDGDAHLLRMPISHLEERWAAQGFIRIHRSYLVPVGQIAEFAVAGQPQRQGVRPVAAGEPAARARRQGQAAPLRAAASTSAAGTSPAENGPRPRKVVVWQHDQARLQHDVIGIGDVQSDTVYGRLLVRSLTRAQLGLSLMCLAIALAVIARCR